MTPTQSAETQRHRTHAVTQWSPFVPYPAIASHGVIGDRRTAALVAADGTIDWLCLPDYDNDSVFGALVDARNGGYWRLGPKTLAQGHQDYQDNTAVLVTRWETSDGDLELTDAMAEPAGTQESGQDARRIVLRRLRCTRGRVSCLLDLWPVYDFDFPAAVSEAPGGFALRVADHTLALWVSRPVSSVDAGVHAVFDLSQGDECWVVLAMDERPADWSAQRARRALEDVRAYWRKRNETLDYDGPRQAQIIRSAMVTHLLGYAPTGAVVAAPTTSLPERIGGDRNYDYRYAWVRDASLSMSVLALLGDTDEAGRFMDWLATLGSSTDAPLQVLYHVSGGTDVQVKERPELFGYRHSQPVRYGNRAGKQTQLGSYGFLLDCALDYLDHGGKWTEGHWNLVRKVADYTADHWRDPDAGIWELATPANYVSSKVMSWVVLDRVLQIADKTGVRDGTDRWRRERELCHAEVMEKGWSEKLQAFRDRYEADSLDASTLLIPVMRFLPPDHPRVDATIERIYEALTIDGLVYRFVPTASPVPSDLPVGEFEGVFLPCTFWLANAFAMRGEVERAEAILDRVDAMAGDVGLYAEEADPRLGTFMGNTPLLFSHAEYVRAVISIARARQGRENRPQSE